MGILDDAIKEHLELKRQHGAPDDELKQLEDEAFGAAERPGDEGSPPDPLAEAPTEFMQQPEIEEQPEARSRRPDIADLQEAPPSLTEEPAEEEAPAMEHEAVPEAPPEPEAEIPSGPTTEEREAIAEQPTEMYDVEEVLAASQPAPSEEDLADEEMDGPRLAPVEPPADEAEEEYEEDDDFWDEKRLSDELDQALEAPSELDEEEPSVEDPPSFDDEVEGEPEVTEAPASRREEDVLEETPDFLEETPEDDQLWFEQKPPKDFDFDD